MALALTIRQLRKRDRYSQAGLAEGAGLDPSSISLIETLKQKPRAETIFSIAQFFNLNIAEFYELVYSNMTQHP